MKIVDYQSKQSINHLKLFLVERDLEFQALYERYRFESMAGVESIFALYSTLQQLISSEIKGDVIDIGCWQGGVSKMIAELLNAAKSKKKLFSIDTFEGYPLPSSIDEDVWGNSMLKRFNKEAVKSGGMTLASYANTSQSLQQIFKYAECIKAKVDESFDFDAISEGFCLASIDVGWYTETKTILARLLPKMDVNSVIFIMDYGHHKGTKKAVDEFLIQHKGYHFTLTTYNCIKIHRLIL